MKDVSFHIKLFVKVGLAVVGNGIPTALHEFDLEVVIADFPFIFQCTVSVTKFYVLFQLQMSFGY